MQCPRCQQENPTSHKFCRECGTPLRSLEGGAELTLSYADVRRSLTEALEQQAARAEILRVISQSPTDTRPVFDTIVRNARRLCEADSCSVFTYRDELIHLESIDNATVEGADAIRRAYPLPPNRGHASGRAILTGRPVHIPDVRDDPEYDLHGILGAELRSILAAPMLRDGLAIGTITLHTWATPQPFTDAHIELLKTFADVIAIENVRLFKETKEALEQQTAMSEILRAIGTSPTELQPVLDAVVKSAVRFCGAHDAELYRLDGTDLKVAAHHGPISAPMGRLIPVARGTVAGRAVLELRAVHVADLQAEVEQ